MKKKKKSLREELESEAEAFRLKHFLENSIQYFIPETVVTETTKKGRLKISFEVEVLR